MEVYNDNRVQKRWQDHYFKNIMALSFPLSTSMLTSQEYASQRIITEKYSCKIES